MRAVQQTEYRFKLVFAHSPDSVICGTHSFVVKKQIQTFSPKWSFYDNLFYVKLAHF